MKNNLAGNLHQLLHPAREWRVIFSLTYYLHKNSPKLSVLIPAWLTSLILPHSKITALRFWNFYNARFSFDCIVCTWYLVDLWQSHSELWVRGELGNYLLISFVRECFSAIFSDHTNGSKLELEQCRDRFCFVRGGNYKMESNRDYWKRKIGFDGFGDPKIARRLCYFEELV